MKTLWRREALDDLSRISAWYRERNPDVSRSMLAKVRRRARELSDFPESGAPVEGRAERTLFVKGTPLVVVYRIDVREEFVDIVAVIDARRRPESRFLR